MSKDLVIKTGEYQKDGETKGEYTKVGQIFQEALLFARKEDNKRNIIMLSSSYADFLVDLGQLEKAKQLFEEILPMFQKIDYKIFHITTLRGYAKYWLVKGILDKSLEKFVSRKNKSCKMLPMTSTADKTVFCISPLI